MISIRKGEKPAILVGNEIAWRDEYLTAKEAGEPMTDTVRYRYRHPEIKSALRLEAYEKCVYCESKLPVGETDHLLPVSFRPELIVDWENLLLACKECNTNKGHYYSAEEPLVDPSREDPDEYLYFFGPAIMPRNGSAKGYRTISKLKLSRLDLLQRRLERVDRLRPLIQEWRTHIEGPTKDLIRDAILKEAGDEAEYSALIRAYLYQELGWAPNSGSSASLTTDSAQS